MAFLRAAIVVVGHLQNEGSRLTESKEA